MNSLKNAYDYFNALCLKYQEIVGEQNKAISSTNSVYFKDQYSVVYEEFMKAFTLIPNENNMNEIARYFKISSQYEGKCYLEQVMISQGVTSMCNNNAEMKLLYNNLVTTIRSIYTNINTRGLTLEYMDLFVKLSTTKLDYISEEDKKYLLNHIIYQLRYTSDLRNSTNIFPVPTEDDVPYSKYKNLLPKNESETNKYYNVLYNMINYRMGGSILNGLNVCPLHVNSTSMDSVSINRSDVFKQISRGSNKKLLNDKNKLKLQYIKNETNGNKYLKKDNYIVGNENDKEYINKRANEIIKKYYKNNKYDVEYMTEQLYKQISNVYTNLPIFEVNIPRYYLTFNNIVVDCVFDIDKEIDKKYFNGKLSYFAKYFFYLMNAYSPNDEICTEYILSAMMNRILTTPNHRDYCLYIMFNYMYDQFDEWLKKIKPLLGLDDKWNYDASKDMNRKKAEEDSKGNQSHLIERYKNTMDINYIKMNKLKLIEENESITEIYGVIKYYYELFKKLMDKLNNSSNIINGSITVDGKDYTIISIINNIKNSNVKDVTYTNNILLNNFGFKKYLTDMLNDFTNENSINIYNALMELDKLRVNQYIEYLTDKNIYNMFNDFSYKNMIKQNNCPECVKNMCKFITEGFYDIFSEINILKQYQEMNYTGKKLLKSGLTKVTNLLDDVFENIGGNKYRLKVNLGTFATFKDGDNYVYDTKFDGNISCDLKANSIVYKYISGSNINEINKLGSDVSDFIISLKADNYFIAGSVFKDTDVEKITIYKPLKINQELIDNNRYFIIPGQYYNNILNIVKDNNIYSYTFPYTIFNKESFTTDSVVINPVESGKKMTIIYADELNYNTCINQYLIKKDENYLYQFKKDDNLKKIIKKFTTKKFTIMSDVYNLAKSEVINIFNWSNITVSKNDTDTEIFEETGKLKGNYTNLKSNTNVLSTNFKNYDLNESYVIDIGLDKYTSLKDNGKVISDNNLGYVILYNMNLSSEEPVKAVIVITDLKKFKEKNEKLTMTSVMAFKYEYDNVSSSFNLKSSPIDWNELPKDETYIILNQDKLEYLSDDIINNDKSLDKDLVYCDWDSPISNVVITDSTYTINNVNVDKNYIIKDIKNMNLDSSKLQKEFYVEDFNKLMLRKCFPDNFKRTLVCNQDVLDAIDGSKYAIPDIKIKEALCEYGKFPLYLEHYFMSSKVDYKLKGKFNLRCIANLGKMPDVVSYLDRDELEYINKEVLVQGEDMIIKNGKIVSSGDVYLVGIEINNDHMLRVPPTKILNKSLLNVIDFQQFDNIYDRIELVLDDENITDYIVKPLTLETIGTLKDMKYINFY